MTDLDPKEFPSPFDNVNQASNLKTYNMSFLRKVDVQIHAENIEIAQKLAGQVLAQFPAETVRLLSVVEEGYKEPADAPKTATVDERRNAQLAVRVRELTDQPEPDRAA